jgi:ATP-dependent RNA helicase DDX3X
MANMIPDSNDDGEHHYLLFSATFDKRMRKLAKKVLEGSHVRIRIGRAGSTHVNVKQSVILHLPSIQQYADYVTGCLGREF